jgi:putative tryptophan/tyrosine transport system substrate-binding protein
MRKYLFALIACVVAFAPLGAAAQTSGKMYRVGLLTNGTGAAAAAGRERLAGSLAQHGYMLDRNLAIEIRSSEAKPERLPQLAKELVDGGADVIVVLSYPAARAAKDISATIPIVIQGAGDPVETGLVASLNRPGGNITGMSDLASELSANRLELLNAAVPGLKRVAMLWNADDLGMTTRYRAAAAAASTLGVAVQPLGVREPDDFNAAFAAMAGEKPDGILMVTDALTRLNRKRVFEFAATHRVPAIYEFDDLARDGGLMSYGADSKETVARVADLVGRILRGIKPADLPFEQPTRFRFVINKKTADALGLALPAAVIDRADEVIE